MPRASCGPLEAALLSLYLRNILSCVWTWYCNVERGSASRRRSPAKTQGAGGAAPPFRRTRVVRQTPAWNNVTVVYPEPGIAIVDLYKASAHLCLTRSELSADPSERCNRLPSPVPRHAVPSAQRALPFRRHILRSPMLDRVRAATSMSRAADTRVNSVPSRRSLTAPESCTSRINSHTRHFRIST